MAFAFSNFDTTENPISEGGVWNSGIGSWGDLQISSGKVRVVSTSVDSAARYNAVNFDPDQYSEVTCAEAGATSGDKMGACTRIASAADGDCYALESDGSNAAVITTYRTDDNGSTLTFNTLLNTTLVSVSVRTNTKIQLRSVGNTHYTIVGGSVANLTTDSTYVTGQPGVSAFASSTARDLLDAWTAGDAITPINNFGQGSTPTDNGTSATDPTVVTPPASMSSGQLVVMYAQARIASLTPTISQAGGQTWTSESTFTTTAFTGRVFWCVFNGTWSANPSVSFSSTTNNTVAMIVYSPPGPSASWSSWTWAVDQSLSSSTHTGSGTIVNTKRTTTKEHTVALAGWGSVDRNTWTSGNPLNDPNATGPTTQWFYAGLGAQVRNLAGSRSSLTIADQVRVWAGDTCDVGNAEQTFGPDAGMKWTIVFYAFAKSYPAGLRVTRRPPFAMLAM